MRAEVGDFDLGQDEEPRVIGYEGEVLLAQLGRPSDEAVARGELPRGDGETKHGEGLAVAVVANSAMDEVASLMRPVPALCVIS